MTKVIESLEEWRSIRNQLEKDNNCKGDSNSHKGNSGSYHNSHDSKNDRIISPKNTIGYVPTMGNLHLGHASLLQRSKRENAISVLSVFINPTQFNKQDDFINYPKTLEQDIILAQKNNVDYVFLPNYKEIYADDYEYRVTNTKSHLGLEGSSRPGHFDGVLTIVMKLLLLVKANNAYFGEKDYEQVKLVQGMSKAFFLDTNVISCPTVRNEFGLPLSSRNNRLSKEQLTMSQWFPKIFHSQQSCQDIKNQLIEKGFDVEYIEEKAGRRFAAVSIGGIRLIDNISIIN